MNEEQAKYLASFLLNTISEFQQTGSKLWEMKAPRTVIEDVNNIKQSLETVLEKEFPHYTSANHYERAMTSDEMMIAGRWDEKKPHTQEQIDAYKKAQLMVDVMDAKLKVLKHDFLTDPLRFVKK